MIGAKGRQRKLLGLGAGRGLAPRNSGRGRGSDFASSQGASIQTSRSSWVVRITGIAFGWIGSTTALGAVVRRAEASVSSAFTMATLKISTGSLTSRLGKTNNGRQACMATIREIAVSTTAGTVYHRNLVLGDFPGSRISR